MVAPVKSVQCGWSFSPYPPQSAGVWLADNKWGWAQVRPAPAPQEPR